MLTTSPPHHPKKKKKSLSLPLSISLVSKSMLFSQANCTNTKMCFQAVQICQHLLSEVSTKIIIKPKIKAINSFTDFLLNLIKKQSSSKVLSVGQVTENWNLVMWCFFWAKTVLNESRPLPQLLIQSCQPHVKSINTAKCGMK